MWGNKKTKMKRVVLQTVALLIVTHLPVQAQVSRAISGAFKAGEHLINPQQIVSAVERATARRALSAQFLAMHHSLAAEQSLAWGTAVALPLERRFIPTLVEPAETAVPKTRSWIEQQQRNVKAWQLKRAHAKQIAFTQALAALPQLQTEQTFYADDLSGLLLKEHQVRQLPPLPLMQRPNYLYRGLSLDRDGESLRKILHHGLLLQDVGHFSNSLLMSLANTPHDAAAISSTKYTNLAQSPQTALQYAFRKVNIDSDDVLPVVISVTDLEEHGAVVRVQHDISAEHLSEVTALLKINDTPTWCSVKLEGSNFKITPYEIK